MKKLQVSRKLSALCSAKVSLKATIPIMIPAAKKMTDTRSQMKPQSCGGPPTRREKAEASDSWTFLKMRSSQMSHTEYKHDMTPMKSTRNGSAMPLAMNQKATMSPAKPRSRTQTNQSLLALKTAGKGQVRYVS